MAASLNLIAMASVGEKMKATTFSVFMALELVLPGQAHRTRISKHY